MQCTQWERSKLLSLPFSLTVRHIGSLKNLFVCALGAVWVRETPHALIWEWRGAGLSRGRQDVDRERMSVTENEKEESFYMERSLRGEWPHYFGPQREREREGYNQRMAGGRRRKKRMWRRDKGGLVFINTITNCHCCHLPPPPFGLPPLSFSILSFLLSFLAVCQISLDSSICSIIQTTMYLWEL